METIISSVPRCNVEELLALEGSPSYYARPQVATPTSRLAHSAVQTQREHAEVDHAKRLPPITPRAKSETRDAEHQAMATPDGDAFFMTQAS